VARNPFRSEAEAYRFVLGTVAYFVAIVLSTAFGGRWVGIAVFVALSSLVLLWFFRREAREAPAQTTPRGHAPGERRILVVANETVAGGRLREEIQAAAAEGSVSHVHVVCPALNSPLRHWVSDEDEARAAAQERLERSIAELGRLGIDATGEIGDSDPVQAIEDALRTFGADVVIISTHPEGKSNWLERGVVKNARERFAVPITHVVVDLAAEAAGRP
jgi:nucleotide-binding universal stress UspA family protein